MSKKKEAVLASSIASLKLPKHTEVWLMRETGPDDLTWNEARERATMMTIREALASFPPLGTSFEERMRYRDLSRSIHYKRLRQLLVKKGLTRLDWHYLPQRTVTLGVLKRLSKEDLLKLPAFLLGTFSGHSLEMLDLNDATVETLAAAEISSYRHKSYRRGIKKTQVLLRLLGITEGAFLHINSLERKIEEVASRHSISKSLARRFVELAQAEHWIPKYLS